jgi:hypothetical protein
MSVQNIGELAAKMSPSQIAEAQRLAREWEPSRLGVFDSRDSYSGR